MSSDILSPVPVIQGPRVQGSVGVPLRTQAGAELRLRVERDPVIGLLLSADVEACEQDRLGLGEISRLLLRTRSFLRLDARSLRRRKRGLISPGECAVRLVFPCCTVV